MSFWFASRRSPSTCMEPPAIGWVIAGVARGISDDELDHDLGIVVSRGLSHMGEGNLWNVLWSRHTSEDGIEMRSYLETRCFYPQDAMWKRTRRVGKVSLADAKIMEFDDTSAFPCTRESLSKLLEELQSQTSRRKRQTRGVRAAVAALTPRKRSAPAPDLVEMDRTAAKQGATIGEGVEIRPSGIHGAGNGLFASKAFKSCDLITMYDGDRLHGGHAEACQLPVQTHVGAKDGIYFDGFPLAKRLSEGGPKWLQGRGGGAFANHCPESCNAEEYLVQGNGGVYNVIFLRVKRGKTIEAGQEILVNCAHACGDTRGNPSEPCTAAI